MSNQTSQMDLFKWVEIALFIAIIMAAIYIHIPMPSALDNSFVHPGNAFVLLTLLLIGPKRGTIAALSALFLWDTLNGYLYVVIQTLLETAVVILVVVSCYKLFFRNQDTRRNIIVIGIIGAITKIIIGYLVFVGQQMLIGTTFDTALIVAFIGMPATVFSAIVTATLVPILYFPLKKIIERFHPVYQ